MHRDEALDTFAASTSQLAKTNTYALTTWLRYAAAPDAAATVAAAAAATRKARLISS